MGGTDNDDFYYMSPINDSTVALLGNSVSTDGALIRCNSFGYWVYHSWLGLVNLHSKEFTWQTSFCSSEDVFPVGLSYDDISKSLYVLMTGGVDGDFASAAINGTIANTYLFKYKVVAATGINGGTKINNELGLYPNPVNNDFTLKITETSRMSDAVIFDAIGREVMPLFNAQQLSSVNINCSHLASGLYFVKVIDTEGKLGVVKLVKE